MFSIELSDNAVNNSGELVLPGKIIFGSDYDDFLSPISYWSRESYISHWKRALGLILDGRDRSALITRMYSPNSANFIFWWVLYLEKDSIVFQQHILFLEELDCKFNEENFTKFIPDRENVSEDGERISEWEVSFNDLEDFYNHLIDCE